MHRYMVQQFYQLGVPMDAERLDRHRNAWFDVVDEFERHVEILR